MDQRQVSLDLMSEFKRVSVIWLWYIGLPTAAMFASNQIVSLFAQRTCKSTVDTINRGEKPYC